MATQQRLVPTTKVYAVGEDLTLERHALLVEKLADWFAQTRKTKEPAALARQELDYCMRGVTKAGVPWSGMESAPLKSRVLAMCRFDIELMQGRVNASDKQRKRKEREKELKRKKQHDGMIPEELRAEYRRTASYGDDPSMWLSSQEHANWLKYREDTLRDYPHLNNTTSLKVLDQLADYVMVAERHRAAFLKGEVGKFSAEDRAEVVDTMNKLMSLLGIHPNQLIKRVADKKDATIGAAALRMAQLDDYRKLRARFWAEELLMAWAMYMQPTADGLGYQIDEIGLYGLTKTRVVHCPKCQTQNWGSFTIEEIEEWLVRKGHLVKVGEGYPTYQPGTPTVVETVVLDEDEEDAGPEAPPSAS